MVENLSKEQVEHIKEAFSCFDVDGDGSISTEELGRAMKALGYRPSRTELEQMINEVDLDGNGIIEFHEFLTVMAQTMQAMEDSEEELQEAFRFFDEQNTGFITAADFRQVMTNLGDRLSDEEVDDMLKAAELDSKGRLNYVKFAKLLTSV